MPCAPPLRLARRTLRRSGCKRISAFLKRKENAVLTVGPRKTHVKRGTPDYQQATEARFGCM